MNAAAPRRGLVLKARKIAAPVRTIGARIGLVLMAIGLVGTVAQGQPRPGVSVSYDHLMRNGRDWVPKGFTWVGHVAPVRALTSGWYERAHAMDEDYLLRQARRLGADTIRIQVSQPGLDPRSPIFDPSYADEVIQAVGRAREAGFVVIVSMQWERPSGLPGQPNMPSASTQRAWLPLFRALGADRGVMLELFNEPANWPDDPKGWPTWGRGMQTLVDEARAHGARNVLVLDGLRSAQILRGAPLIHDGLNQLAYAVHPYITRVSPPDSSDFVWGRNWGEFSNSHAVIVTEWNEIPEFHTCADQTAHYARRLVAYLAERRVGLILWAQDLPSTMFDRSGHLRSFARFNCSSSDWGAATVAVRYFRAN